jgi:flagellar basal body-associated protein FliL
MAYTELTPTAQLNPVEGNGSAAKTKRKKRTPKLMVALVLAVAVATFAVDKFLFSKKTKPVTAVPGAVVSLPETTLNLSDGSLLQVKLALELQKGVGGKSGSLPAWQIARIEDDEISTLSGFTEATLLSAHGKAEAMAELLALFRSVVGPGPVGPGVMAVYYTDFVMQ